MAQDEDKKGAPEEERAEERAKEAGEEPTRPAWLDEDPFSNRVVINPPKSDGVLARPPAAKSTPAAVEAGPTAKSGETASAKATAPAASDEASRPKVSVDPELLEPPSTSAPRRGAAAGGPPPSRRPRQRVPTEVQPRLSRGGPESPPPYSDDEGSRPAGRRLLRVPLWMWFLVLVSILVIVPLSVDLLNRDNYRLSCKKGLLEAKRHRRFPWPVGFERLAGPLRPVKLAADTSCVGNQDFQGREELEAAFLDQLIAQVRRGVANPASRNLKEMRAQINQARQLALLDAHMAQRKMVKQILADLNYREGRARLGRVEMSLREALALLREAQKLAGERYEDLADWISHIESLLRTLAPPPSGSAIAPGAPLPALPLPKVPKKGKEPKDTSPLTPSPALPTPPPDGGAPADAGPAATGSGILM